MRDERQRERERCRYRVEKQTIAGSRLARERVFFSGGERKWKKGVGVGGAVAFNFKSELSSIYVHHDFIVCQ